MFSSRHGFWISALLGILCFPPIGWWPLSYIAMVPFLAAACSPNMQKPFRSAYLAGLFFFLGLLYWIGFNSGAPGYFTWPSVIAIVLILATIWGLTAWSVARAAKRHGLIAATLLFIVLYQFQEIFWGTGELGFPWAVWSLSQSSFLPAIQVGEFVDTFGISFWVLILNGLAFLALKSDFRTGFAWGFAGVLLIPLAYGSLRMKSAETGTPVRVAAVQADIPAEFKWDMSAEEILDRHSALTKPLAGTNVQLIVWPETAAPMPLRYRSWALDSLHDLSDYTNAILLTGATDYETKPGEGMLPYNTAFVFSPGTRDLQSSAKIHLVPFGERIPWQNIFPFLGKIRLGQAEFAPGSEPVVYETNPPFGCLICFEVIFSDITAALIQDGAQLLTQITNDGWYGNSSGPYQHLHLARMRAVVARRSMVRSANTGISALILPSGRFDKTLGYNELGVISGELPLRTEITLAVKLQPIWIPFYTGLLAGVIAALWWRGRRMRIVMN